MSYFIRRVTGKYWSFKCPNSMKKLPADLITMDMRTEDNSFSLYKIEKNNFLNKVILGLAINRERIQKLQYIRIDESRIKSEKFKIQKTDGHTKLDVVNNNHFDIINLKSHTIVELAWFLAKIVEKGDTETIPKQEIKKMITEAINCGEIDISVLTKNVQEEITANQ